MNESIGEIIESTKELFKSKGWGRNPQEINEIGCSWFAMTIAYEIGDNIEDYMFVGNGRIYYKKRFIELP